MPLQPYPTTTTTVATTTYRFFPQTPSLKLSSEQQQQQPSSTDEQRPLSFAENQQQLQDDLRISNGDARQQVAAIRRFQRLAEQIYAQQLVEYQDILERLAVLTARADGYQQTLLLQQQELDVPQELYQPQEQPFYPPQQSQYQDYPHESTYSQEEGQEQGSYREEQSYRFGTEEFYQVEQQNLVENEQLYLEQSYDEEGVEQQAQPYQEQPYESLGSEEQQQQQQQQEQPEPFRSDEQYEFEQPYQPEYEFEQPYQEQIYAQENELQSYPTEAADDFGIRPPPPSPPTTDADATAFDILTEIDTLTERATELVAEREQQQLELQQLPTTAIEIESQTPPEAVAMFAGIPFQLEEMEDADTCTSEVVLNADFTVTVGETDGPIYKEATGTWSAIQVPNSGTDDNDHDDSELANNVNKKNNGMMAMSMTLVRHYQAGHEATESTDVGEFTFAVERNFIGTLTYVGDRLAISGNMFIEDEIFGDDEIGYFNMIDTRPSEGDDDDAWKPAKVGRSLRQS